MLAGEAMAQQLTDYLRPSNDMDRARRLGGARDDGRGVLCYRRLVQHHRICVGETASSQQRSTWKRLCFSKNRSARELFWRMLRREVVNRDRIALCL